MVGIIKRGCKVEPAKGHIDGYSPCLIEMTCLQKEPSRTVIKLPVFYPRAIPLIITKLLLGMAICLANNK